jgi:hypothetical protein
MAIGRWRPPTCELGGLPPDYGLIVRSRPPSSADKAGTPVWAAQFLWSLRCRRELPFDKPHVEQLIMLEKRGVSVPPGRWIALSDPFTADPLLFKRAGKMPQRDVVLELIRVTAALALELAVSNSRLPLLSCSEKIVRTLGKADLLAPGGRHKRYTHHALKKWRDEHKRSKLFVDCLDIFQAKAILWTDALEFARVESCLRANLHRLHQDDPAGRKTRTVFEQFVAQLRMEHDQIQREHFFPKTPS